MIKLTREQFASDKRAEEIRTTCLDIANIIHNMEVSTKDSDEEVIARLSPYAKKLQEMGIVAHMHIGVEDDRFNDNPLLVAEFVAGRAVSIITNKSFYAFNILENMIYVSFDEI